VWTYVAMWICTTKLTALPSLPGLRWRVPLPERLSVCTRGKASLLIKTRKLKAGRGPQLIIVILAVPASITVKATTTALGTVGAKATTTALGARAMVHKVGMVARMNHMYNGIADSILPIMATTGTMVITMQMASITTIDITMPRVNTTIITITITMCALAILREVAILRDTVRQALQDPPLQDILLRHPKRGRQSHPQRRNLNKEPAIMTVRWRMRMRRMRRATMLIRCRCWMHHYLKCEMYIFHIMRQSRF